MIDQVKKKIFPALDDAGRTMHALADTTEAIDQGRGNVGRLLKNEDLANQLTEMLANLKTATEQVNTTLTQVQTMTKALAGPQGAPALLHRADDALASVQKATRDLAGATPRLPAISRDVASQHG